MKVGIVDYGMGNLNSVFNAIESLGVNVKICHNPSDLQDIDKIVLPGVGSFHHAMKNLREKNFLDILNEKVIINKRPFLGICLGMQLLLTDSEEGGSEKGLDWISGSVKKINFTNVRVPHIGWNNIEYKFKHDIFNNIPQNTDFYFVHSYHVCCNNLSQVIAECEYGLIPIAAVIQNEHIYGVQFHPEKSQESGQKLISNFLSI